MQGSGNVTAEIERILKMDAVQFRQIVMLAQGEFRAFMEAKDDRRKEILGGLFDSTPYRLFQERLKAAKDELERRRSVCRQRIEQALQPDAFILPEDMTKEQRAAFDPDLPYALLAQNLASLLTQDDEAFTLLEQELDTLAAAKSALDQRKGAAEQGNKLYQEWQQDMARAEALAKRKPQMEAAQAALEETSRAVHQVKPFRDRADAAEDARRMQEIQWTDVQRRLAECAASLEQAKAHAEKTGTYRQQAQACTEAIAKTQAHRHDVEALQLQRQAAAAADALREKIEKDAMRAQTAIDTLTASSEQMKQELESLTNAEEALAEARAAHERQEALLGRLIGVGGVRDSVQAAIRAETAAAAAEKQWGTSVAAADAAEAAFSSMRRLYMEGYAGKLADQLREKLHTDGEANCPVCGTRFCGADHAGRFAAHQEETPTDEQLDRAEQQKNKAADSELRLRRDWQQKQADFGAACSTVTGKLDELFPDQSPWDWKTIRLGQALEKLAAVCRANVASAAAAKQKAEQDKLRKDQLTGLLRTAAEKLQQAKDDLAACRERHAAAMHDGQRAADEAVRLQNVLQEADMAAYTSAEAVDQALQAMEKRRQQLQEDAEKAEKWLQTVSHDHALLKGEAESLGRSYDEAVRMAEEALLRWREALTEHGFEDERRYQAALERIGDMEPEQWLDLQRAEQLAYDSDVKATQQRLQEREKHPPVLTSLETIEQALQANAAMQRTLNGQRTELDHRRVSHRRAQQTLLDGAEDLRRVDAAYTRLARLSEIANGSTGVGGKRAFDGYVLSHTFEEVLEHASYYLSLMTGGKYELKHDTEAGSARQNASADFRIIVSDRLTGLQREIGSLSGGESFQASMALALGLSDTVQSHASTVKIDTMFIDEGFGTLDSNSLDQMMSLLDTIGGGRRQVGVISHVRALEERFGKFIRVTASKDKKGSSLRQEC